MATKVGSNIEKIFINSKIEMIEVYPNLYVGSQIDCKSLLDSGWAFAHICKEPYHRKFVGYTERALSKDHPEYLIAVRGNEIALNIVDADRPEFFADSMINSALDFIDAKLKLGMKVLVHCNQGLSRSPSIAMLYMKKDLSNKFEEAEKQFKNIYPNYLPKNGIREYCKNRWSK